MTGECAFILGIPSKRKSKNNPAEWHREKENTPQNNDKQNILCNVKKKK